MVAEALVGGQLRAPDGLAQRRPVAAGLQAGEGQHPVVLGDVVARQRVAREPGGRGRRPAHAELERERHGLAHGPQADPEERDVDDRGLAGALAVVQGAHDPPGDGHAADRVAEPRSGRDRHQVVLGSLGAGGDAGPRPEGQRVVGPLVGVGPPLALPGAPHVDDVGVLGPDVLHADLELVADRRELVGEEDVGRLGQAVEDGKALRRGQVEAEAPLAPVRVLQQHVDVGGDQGDAGRGEPPHGVAPLDVLDLDDLGPEVGQGRRGRRDEGVLGHFQDPHALEHCGHRQPPLRLRIGPVNNPSPFDGTRAPPAASRSRAARQVPDDGCAVRSAV